MTSHAHRSYGGRGTINEENPTWHEVLQRCRCSFFEIRSPTSALQPLQDSERTAQWRLPDGPVPRLF